MKKLVLVAALAALPVSGAYAAGEAAADKKAAGGVKAVTVEQPSWDTRQAGQGIDLKGKGDKATKEEK